MQLEKDKTWLKNSLFQRANPHPFVIDAVISEAKEKDKVDIILFMTSKVDDGQYCMSIWQRNKNILIEKLGRDTDQWIGHKISVSDTVDTEGTHYKDIAVI